MAQTFPTSMCEPNERTLVMLVPGPRYAHLLSCSQQLLQQQTMDSTSQMLFSVLTNCFPCRNVLKMTSLVLPSVTKQTLDKLRHKPSA